MLLLNYFLWNLIFVQQTLGEDEVVSCWNRTGRHSNWRLHEESSGDLVTELRPSLTGTRTKSPRQNVLLRVNEAAGSVARLPCPVRQLGNRTVSWLRHLRDGMHLLTTGSMTYTSSDRFSIEYRYPGNWTLKIIDLRLEDAGCYQCQVNTYPPISLYVQLQIQGPMVLIVDRRNESVREASFESGTSIQLICTVRATETLDGVSLVWRHGHQVLNHDIQRGGVSVRIIREESSVFSWLAIARATTSDTGTYTCEVNGIYRALVQVHIVQGETPAAVHRYTTSGNVAGAAVDFKRPIVFCLLELFIAIWDINYV